jgi:hypothetical protein
MDLYRWRLLRNDFTAEAAEGTEEEKKDKFVTTEILHHVQSCLALLTDKYQRNRVFYQF